MSVRHVSAAMPYRMTSAPYLYHRVRTRYERLSAVSIGDIDHLYKRKRSTNLFRTKTEICVNKQRYGQK